MNSISLSQGLQTLQGVKLATMHDHQEGCLLLNITCSAIHCHKVEELVTENKVMSVTGTLIWKLQMHLIFFILIVPYARPLSFVQDIR